MLGKRRAICLFLLIVLLAAPAAADISQKFSFQNPEDDMVGWLWSIYEPCNYEGGYSVEITNLTDATAYDFDWEPLAYRRIGPGLDVNFLRTQGFEAYVPSHGPFAYFAWSTMDSWNEYYKVGDYPYLVVYDDEDNPIGDVSEAYCGEVIPTTRHESRWEVIRKYNKCQLFKNGVFYSNESDCTETFYEMYIFPQVSDFGCEYAGYKDLIIGGGSPHMISGPPRSWYVAKDLVDPSLSGLYDQYGNVVYDSTMHFHWSTGMLDGSMPGIPTWEYFVKVKNMQTEETVWTYDLHNDIYRGDCCDEIPCYYCWCWPPEEAYSLTGTVDFDFGTNIIDAGKPYGAYQIGFYKGDNLIAWDYFIYKANGATVTFNKGTYTQGEVIRADVEVSGTYWQPETYTYRFDILDLTGEVVDTDPITSQTAILYYDSDEYPAGDYYGVVIATKRSDASEYTLGFDLFTIADYVDVQGYTMDGYANSLLSGVLVNESQTPYWYNTTASGGLYNLSGMFTGITISVNASHPGYNFSTYGWNPITYGLYDVNLTLLPDYIPNNTAFVGVIQVDWSGAPVDGATVYISNLSWSTTTTSNLAGYYIFDNLLGGSDYTLSAYKTGYGNASYVNTSTTVSGQTVTRNLNLAPEYTVTITVKNQETGLAITDEVAVSITPTGEESTTTTGIVTFDLGYGLYTATAISNDYVTTSQSFVMTGDKSVSIYMAPKSTASQGTTTFYSQRQVKIKIVDGYGNPLEGAHVVVNYIASQLPSTDVNWLVSAFGITEAVALDMVNSSVAMSGWTATDGATVFTMFPSLTYGITITNATIGLDNYRTLAPADLDYTIYCPLAGQTGGSSMVEQLGNTSMWYEVPDSQHMTFCGGYTDSSGYTTDLEFHVWKWGNTTSMAGLPTQVYSYDFGAVGTTDYVEDCNYTATIIHGDEYKWQWNISRSQAV